MKKLFCFMCLLGLFYAGDASAQYNMSAPLLGDSNLTTDIGTGGIGLVEAKKCYIDGSGREVCPGDVSLPVNPGITLPKDPEPDLPTLPGTIPFNPNLPNLGGIGEVAILTSGTVSSCPSGTTMSSDKCCCVNN